MSRAIPLGPLTLALSGLGLMGVSLYLAISGESETPRTATTPGERAAVQDEGVALLTYHDAVRARGYVDIVLGQSPFVSDRSAYSRNLPVVAAPSQPELTPEFVGTMGRGESISALVIWEQGQPARAHSIGEETPWGMLVSATSSRLVFEGEKGRRELELF